MITLEHIKCVKRGSQTLYMEDDYVIYYPNQGPLKSERGIINDSNKMSVTVVTRVDNSKGNAVIYIYIKEMPF